MRRNERFKPPWKIHANNNHKYEDKIDGNI